MNEPRCQYTVAGDDAVYYSPTPVYPGMIINGHLVVWVGNHGGPRKRKS